MAGLILGRPERSRLGLSGLTQRSAAQVDPGSRASLRNCSPSSLVLCQTYRIDPPFLTVTGIPPDISLDRLISSESQLQCIHTYIKVQCIHTYT